MPIELNGQTVGDITLNGNTIDEVTVNATTVYTSAPPEAGRYLYVQERGSGIRAYETNTPGVFSSSDLQYTVGYGGAQRGSAIALNRDGTRVYYSNDDVLFQEDLSTPFDLRTNSGSSTTFDTNVGANNSYGFGIVFFNNGSSAYVSGGENTGDGLQRLYSLSTPYDIGTMNQVQDDSVEDDEQGASVLDFNPDGTKAYNSERGGDTIAQYDLSTPFDLSTKSNRTTVERGEDNVGFKWGPDGTTAAIAQHSPDQWSVFTASTPYDVTSLSTESTVDTGGAMNGIFISGPAYY